MYSPADRAGCAIATDLIRTLKVYADEVYEKTRKYLFIQIVFVQVLPNPKLNTYSSSSYFPYLLLNRSFSPIPTTSCSGWCRFNSPSICITLIYYYFFYCQQIKQDQIKIRTLSSILRRLNPFSGDVQTIAFPNANCVTHQKFKL